MNKHLAITLFYCGSENHPYEDTLFQTTLLSIVFCSSFFALIYIPWNYYSKGFNFISIGNRSLLGFESQFGEDLVFRFLFLNFTSKPRTSPNYDDVPF